MTAVKSDADEESWVQGGPYRLRMSASSLSFNGQARITAPAIGDYPRARRRGPGNEGMKAARGEIPDRRQPDATWLALGR